MATVAGTKRLLDISGNNISTAVSLEAEGTLLDSGGLAGSAGQVLSSTSTGVSWINNDTGDVTGVTAGTGMTGGGTSGTVTLNVIGGTGITANANDIAVDATVVTLTGSQALSNKTGSNSQWTNDEGYTTNTGDITSVAAGTGLTGGGTSGAVTLNVAANTYTPYNDIRSLGVPAFTNGTNPNITTAQVMAEIEGDGGFDSYSSVFKTSWSYAGNYNLTDAGGFTETAGSSWITWTDNSSDTTRGNITALAIAPNTGGSAGGVFIYNDQGSSYSPGWREVWTSRTDGSGSGLDADLLDGQEGTYYLDYNNFTNTPTIPQGDITSVAAGSGMTGGGTSGAVTLNVIGGSGITANANDIAVDATVVRTTTNQSIAGIKSFSGKIGADGGIDGLTIANGGITGDNYNISGVNQLTINDPGEGIVFTGTTDVTLFTIDDTTDSILKITNASALQVNAKITNLSNPTGAGDAANKAYVDSAVAGVPQGDITAVTAGNGLTGGGTSGAVTLNVVGGTGITANANDIAIDATVATLAGTQTFTGAKTINTLKIGTANKIQFANNDFIRYNDATGVGRFHFDSDGGTNNASVQAATFVGALSGNATSASTALSASAVTINSGFSGTYPMLVEVEASGVIYNNTNVTYNGSSNTLTSPNFAGNLTGTATLASKLKAGGTGPSAEDLNAVANSVSVGQLEYRGYNSASTNKPPASDNANGVITVGQHNGNYNAQVAFSSDGNMYWRDNPGSSNGSWRKMWDAGNDGASSGLDADKLDGQEGSYYYPASNPSGYTTNTGDITSVVAGTNLNGGGPSGAVTLNLDTNISLDEVNIGSGIELRESADRPDLLQVTSSTSIWAGLQIRNSSNEGRWSFMTDGSTAGFYDDENNEWAVQMVENNAVQLYYNSSLKFKTNSTGVDVLGSININDNIAHGGDSNTYIGFPSNDTWRVVTAGSERLRVNSSGNVGIGTPSPDLKLDVISGTNNGIRIAATDTTDNWRDLNIRSYVSQAQANALPSGSAIYTTNPASQTETAFSKYGGLVLQGRDDGNSSFAIRLGNGNGYATRMFMGATGATVFSNTVTATNFINSSDERLKENIKEASGDKVEVNWKTFEFKMHKGDKRYGVIAQELEENHPEFVQTDNEGMKSVAYTDLLIAKIAELENRIQTLENN